MHKPLKPNTANAECASLSVLSSVCPSVRQSVSALNVPPAQPPASAFPASQSVSPFIYPVCLPASAFPANQAIRPSILSVCLSVRLPAHFPPVSPSHLEGKHRQYQRIARVVGEGVADTHVAFAQRARHRPRRGPRARQRPRPRLRLSHLQLVLQRERAGQPPETGHLQWRSNSLTS
jgi:hypothetical protein